MLTTSPTQKRDQPVLIHLSQAQSFITFFFDLAFNIQNQGKIQQCYFSIKHKRNGNCSLFLAAADLHRDQNLVDKFSQPSEAGVLSRWGEGDLEEEEGSLILSVQIEQKWNGAAHGRFQTQLTLSAAQWSQVMILFCPRSHYLHRSLHSQRAASEPSVNPREGVLLVEGLRELAGYGCEGGVGAAG